MKTENQRLKRACDLIKSDRIGLSTGIEKAVCRSVSVALSDFFSLAAEPETTIIATEKGFEVSIKAKVKSVKSFRTIEGL